MPRQKPDAQKLASQVGRALERLKGHKSFSYRVDAEVCSKWENKAEAISRKEAYDGGYLLHTHLKAQSTPANTVLLHYKNLFLEVESAFGELKSDMQVRPVHPYRADQVVNHVRVCFVAYWLSARLLVEWRPEGGNDGGSCDFERTSKHPDGVFSDWQKRGSAVCAYHANTSRFEYAARPAGPAFAAFTSTDLGRKSGCITRKSA